METSAQRLAQLLNKKAAPPTGNTALDPAEQRRDVILRFIEHGYTSLSQQDKAIFSIDTWNVWTDTPESLIRRIRVVLRNLPAEADQIAQALAERFPEEIANLGLTGNPFLDEQPSQQAGELDRPMGFEVLPVR